MAVVHDDQLFAELKRLGLILPDDPTFKAVLDSRYVAVPTAWAGVTFQNSWVNYGAPNQVCQYQRIGDRGYLRGIMKGGTLSTVSFTLPFAPPASLVKTAVANGVFSILSIDNAGNVTPIGGSNVYQTIDCDFSLTA